MMPRNIPKPVALLITSAVLIAVGVVFGVPHLLDGTRQGQALALQLAAASGQQVRIEGPVRVALWPSPHLAIGQLKLVSASDQTELLSVPRVDLNVSLGSLLSGTYAISSVSLIDPVMTLPAVSAANPAWLTSAQSALTKLSIRDVAATNATLVFGRAPAQVETIDQLNMRVALPEESTLVQAVAEGQWRNSPVSLDLDVGRPMAGAPALFSAHLAVGAAETTAELTGMYKAENTAKPIEGQLSIKVGQGAALWALGSSLGLMPTAPSDPGLTAPLDLGGAVEVGAEGYVLRALKLTLGDVIAQGSARLAVQPTPGISLALQVSKLDLARFPSVLTLARGGQFVLPADRVGAFDLAIAGLSAGALTTGPVQLKGDVAGGQIRLSALSIALPGSSEVKFDGTLSPKADGAALDLKMAASSTDLRGLFNGLGITLPSGLDEAALRQANLQGRLTGTWARPGVSDLGGTLDGIELGGQMTVRGDTGRYDANLTLSQFDVNRYMGLGTASDWVWLLPPTSLSLALKAVRLAGQTADSVNLNADLDPGMITIRALDAADFGGNRFRLSGTLSQDPGKVSDLVLRLTSPDFAVLRENFAPAAALLPEFVAQHLSGPTELSVRWRTEAGQRQRLSNLSLGGDGRLDLAVTQPASGLPSWKARLQMRETSQLLARLAPSVLVRPDAVLGAVDLYAEGAEQEGGLWQIAALQGQIAGMGLKGGDLLVLPQKPVQVSGQVQIASASLDLWQQNLVPLELARVLTGDLDFALDRLTLLGAPMSDVTAKLTLLPGGKISLPTFSGRWREGTLAMTGEAQLGASTALKGTIDLRAANVTLRSGPRFGVSGLLDLNLDVTTSGQNSREWLANLEGAGDFTIDSGNFNGLDFAELTETLQQERSRANLPVLLSRSGQTSLSAFGGDFSIEDGVAKATQLRLRTPSASAEMTAQMDLAGPNLDVASEVTLREFETAPTFRLLLNGPLSSVTPTFEADALAQFFKGPTAATAAPAATDKPADDMTAADAAEPNTTAAAEDDGEIKPPTPPAVPSAADAEDTATVPAEDEAGADATAEPAPAAAPPRRNINRRATSTAAAPRRPVPTSAPVPEADAPPPALGNGSSPPSIQELLSAMPGLSDSAAAAVSEARGSADTPDAAAAPAPRTRAVAPAPAPSPASSGGLSIDFTPAPAAASPPAQAPEFEGVAVQTVPDTSPAPSAAAPVVQTSDGARETRTEGLTIRLPPASSSDADTGSSPDTEGGETPAPSVQELMQRVEGE